MVIDKNDYLLFAELKYVLKTKTFDKFSKIEII